MATPDGNYLIVTHVVGETLQTTPDTNLGHAKEDAIGRAKALHAAGLEFHVFVITANDPNDHHLDLFTQKGRIPGHGPVTIKK